MKPYDADAAVRSAKRSLYLCACVAFAYGMFIIPAGAAAAGGLCGPGLLFLLIGLSFIGLGIWALREARR